MEDLNENKELIDFTYAKVDDTGCLCGKPKLGKKKKVALFLQAVDKRYRKELELMLEVPNPEDGITADWNEVTNVINLGKECKGMVQ